MKKLHTKTATATVSKARRADTYRGARRNLAREIRAEASLRGRPLPWPTAWQVAQQAAYRAEKAASAARKAKSVKVFESIGAKVAAVDIDTPITPVQVDPVPVDAVAVTPKKPRAKKAAAPKPETDAPKAPRKATAKAPKAADAKPKAAPRKRVVKPAA